MATSLKIKAVSMPTGGLSFLPENRHLPVVYRNSTNEALKTNPFFKRAGIIPYYKSKSGIHYALFIDATYNQLTDGGGTIKYLENPIHAAVRELYEESFGVFDFRSEYLTNQIIEHSQCIYTDEILCIFQEINFPSDTYMATHSRIFRQKYEEAILMKTAGKKVEECMMENNFLVWIDEKTLCNISFKNSWKHTNIPLYDDIKEFVVTKTEYLHRETLKIRHKKLMFELMVYSIIRLLFICGLVRKYKDDNGEPDRSFFTVMPKIISRPKSRDSEPPPKNLQIGKIRYSKQYIKKDIIDMYPSLFWKLSGIFKIIYTVSPSLIY